MGVAREQELFLQHTSCIAAHKRRTDCFITMIGRQYCLDRHCRVNLDKGVITARGPRINDVYDTRLFASRYWTTSCSTRSKSFVIRCCQNRLVTSSPKPETIGGNAGTSDGIRHSAIDCQKVWTVCRCDVPRMKV